MHEHSRTENFKDRRPTMTTMMELQLIAEVAGALFAELVRGNSDGLAAVRRRFPGLTDQQLRQAIEVYDAGLGASQDDKG
jgi:hypothetical protein